ncbi:GNAT family N-acetyltransferase [Aestuariibacter halophilus]|uniref:GNAT family N-acetyltransferase n=1 Tax=Fluctibacter halophilus TaxID=226011 RepID=A0ABS8G8V9_9ALTE|nr:GNAT family N-acetyltransferase [Aestuariibacter halophilus]MCC2617012.1 GNAT family N-acetyltransferase [Aestuariibacter halophilus]
MHREWRVKGLSAADARHAAALIYSSGPRSLSALFDVDDVHTALDFLGLAFAADEGQFSHRYHQGVHAPDGRLVGLVTHWHGPPSVAYRQATLQLLLDYYGEESTRAVIGRSQCLAPVVTLPDADRWILGHLGVDPAFHRQGIARSLVNAVEQAAQQAGCATLGLDVEADNDTAIAFYQSIGFKPLERNEPDAQGASLGLVPHLFLSKSLAA